MRVRIIALVLVAASALGCGGTKGGNTASDAPKPVADTQKFKGALRCDASVAGRELSYHDLASRGKPDMVEVIQYTTTASGTEGRVICMELDTNHDGVLDVLRLFKDDGALESEEADRNYDGKSDAWTYYEKGLVVRQEFDSTFSSGKADEFKYYKDGKLKRVERDRNHDGKVDVYEYYATDGTLERIGVDSDFDGRIDVWYRDEVARAEARKVAAASAPAASASAAPSAAPSASSKRRSAEAE
jgi:hypothetical protein